MQGRVYARMQAAFRITCTGLLYVTNESEHEVDFYLSSIDYKTNAR